MKDRYGRPFYVGCEVRGRSRRRLWVAEIRNETLLLRDKRGSTFVYWPDEVNVWRGNAQEATEYV
jgi:hypothetical protein